MEDLPASASAALAGVVGALQAAAQAEAEARLDAQKWKQRAEYLEDRLRQETNYSKQPSAALIFPTFPIAEDDASGDISNTGPVTEPLADAAQRISTTGAVSPASPDNTRMTAAWNSIGKLVSHRSGIRSPVIGLPSLERVSADGASASGTARGRDTILNRRNTMPALAVAPSQLRSISQHSGSDEQASPAARMTAYSDSRPLQHATLGSLAKLLLAASVLQCPSPLRPKSGGAGGPATQPGLGSASRQPHGSGSHGGRDGEEGEEEHSKLWLEDDGASGVGAAAAAAVSVALARSWHASAHESQKLALEEAEDGSMGLGRAGFRLTVAMPKNNPRILDRRAALSSDNSLEGKVEWQQGGESMRHNWSAPALEAAEQAPLSDVRNSDVLAGQGSHSGRTVLNAKATADDHQGLGAQLKLHWLSSPRTFLLVAKPTAAVKPAVSAVIAWLLQRGLTVYLEPRLHAEIAADEVEKAAESSSEDADKSEIVRSASGGSTSEVSHKSIQTAGKSYRGSGDPVTRRGQLLTWTPEQAAADNVPADHVPRATAEKLDLVVTLGGDGTVLWMGTLLGKGPVPPVIPFAMGSLGFMTPFQLEAMPEVLSQMVKGGFSLMLRHRLHCSIVRCGNACEGSPPIATDGVCERAPLSEHVVLNEMVMDRGMSPFLTSLDCFADGAFFTHVQGDGLIVATPTGSTAYNLAAGGACVHPQVQCILLTQIAAHTLTSRPLVFPEHVKLRIQVPTDSRSEIWCSFDGKERQRLCPGDAVVVQRSTRPMPVVCKDSSSQDWFSALQEGLNWNSRGRQAGTGS